MVVWSTRQLSVNERVAEYCGVVAASYREEIGGAVGIGFFLPLGWGRWSWGVASEEKNCDKIRGGAKLMRCYWGRVIVVLVVWSSSEWLELAVLIGLLGIRGARVCDGSVYHHPKLIKTHLQPEALPLILGKTKP